MKKQEQCILELLAASPEPLYGLDMISRSDGKLAHGVIYVWLSRLEDRGLVSSALAPGSFGRRKYAITDAGRAAAHSGDSRDG